MTKGKDVSPCLTAISMRISTHPSGKRTERGSYTLRKRGRKSVKATISIPKMAAFSQRAVVNVLVVEDEGFEMSSRAWNCTRCGIVSADMAHC